MNYERGIATKLKTIKDFAYEAKMSSFARQDDKTIMPDNSSVYSYRRFREHPKFAGLIYTDQYSGNIVDSGQETISLDLAPVWRNQYHGGSRAFFRPGESELADQFESREKIHSVITAFLKQALLEMPEEFPVRGPRKFEAGAAQIGDQIISGDWLYTNEWNQLPLFETNDPFASFQGLEKISFNGKEVYFHGYQGGLIFDKYFPLKLRDGQKQQDQQEQNGGKEA